MSPSHKQQRKHISSSWLQTLDSWPHLESLISTRTIYKRWPLRRCSAGVSPTCLWAISGSPVHPFRWLQIFFLATSRNPASSQPHLQTVQAKVWGCAPWKTLADWEPLTKTPVKMLGKHEAFCTSPSSHWTCNPKHCPFWDCHYFHVTQKWMG